MSTYLPPVVIEVMGNDRQFLATIARDKAILAKFASTVTTTQLSANPELLLTDLARAKVELYQFATEVTDANLGVNAEPFWAEINAIRATLDSTSPLDINVDLNTTSVLSQIATLKGELAMAQLGGLGGIGGDVGGGLGGATGAAGAAAGGLITFMHVAHLFMPEIIGLGVALASVGIGFAALGVASIGAATDIAKGFSAVSSAQNAIAAAIPGTTQWATGITALGQAWSSIPTALQPAVSAINNLMQGFGNSPMSKEIQGFLGAQAQTLTGMFSHAGGTFAPLILATQRAMVTVEGIIQHAMGSGGLTRFVSSISKMVGPAMVELTQLAAAVAHIALGFATAVQDGQGMEMLVSLFRSIGAIVNTGFFHGFIAGWVDFDRLISVALAWIARLLGVLSGLGANLQGLGTVLGFVVSGLVAVKSAIFLLGRAGVGAGGGLATFGSSMSTMLKTTAGVGLMAAGITGLAGNITSLLGVSNPISALWHGIGDAFGWVSKKAGDSINTINGYTLQLSGAIPVTGQLSAAMDLLVRSEQSIGSSLGGLASGFRPLTLTAIGAGTAVSTVTDSVNTLISTLQGKNQNLAQWAADAQILIKRGMDPSAVASLAQQAPQDLASMVTGTTSQLQQMNVQWQEQMLLAQMSGQNGINGFVQSLQKGITSGTPTVKAAAAALATQLGNQLNVPFNGSVQSVQAIGAALSTLPASVIATLAGKTHQYAGAATDASAKTTALKGKSSSLAGTLLSVGSNLAMTIGGFAMMGGSIRRAIAPLASMAASLFGVGAAGDAAGAGEAAAIWPLALIVVAVAAVGIAIYELVTHWKTVWDTIKSVAADVWNWLKGHLEIVAIVNPILAGIILLVEHWSTVWGTIKSVALDVWNAIKGEVIPAVGVIVTVVTAGLDIIKAVFTGVWDAVVSIVTGAWDAIASIVNGAIGVVEGIVKVFAALFTGNWTALWNAVKGIVSSVWGVIVGVFDAVSGTLSGVIQALSNTVTSIWNAMWSAVVGAVTFAWASVTGAVSIGISAVVGAFSKAGTWLYNAGRAIIMGLVHGINSAVGAAVHAVAGVGKSIVHRVTSFFGISSPSRLMQGIGVNVMQGMTLGIAGGSGQAVTQATRTAQSILQAFSPVTGNQGLIQGGTGGSRLGANAGMGMGGLSLGNVTFQINAPGGDPLAIRNAVEKTSAQVFAQQTLTSLRAGAGTVY